MYSLFVRNVEGFLKTVDNKYLRNCFEPITLLADGDRFFEHKTKNTYEYRNLILILNIASNIKNTKKYHRFGTFLREVHEEGFLVDENNVNFTVPTEIIDEQISLLWQCMFFNYVLDN